LAYNENFTVSTYSTPCLCEKSERFYQEMFMSEYGGTMEVLLQDGTRCDIITKTHAIEVDFANKRAEAIGQSLNFALQTNKKAGIYSIKNFSGMGRTAFNAFEEISLFIPNCSFPFNVKTTTSKVQTYYFLILIC